MPDNRNAPDTKLEVSGTTIPHRHIRDALNSVSFVFVRKLVVPFLLQTTYFDRFNRSIHLVERKIFLYHYTPVPILMLYEAWSRAKRNKPYSRQDVSDHLALLETPTRRGLNYMTVSRQLDLKYLCGTTVQSLHKRRAQ